MVKKMARERITEEVKRKLWSESMGRCMNPACKAHVVFDEGDIIEQAHIVPYCETADNSYENLIILCPNCHTNFDKNGAYTVNEVKNWKAIRKAEVENFFDNNKRGSSIINSLDEDLQLEYDVVRKKIAKALIMYACCFSNPIDLAKTHDHKLPSFYKEGSDCLRELASELTAIYETSSVEQRKLYFPNQSLKEIAGDLIGLSNSFATPYNCPDSFYNQEIRRNWIKSIREGLNLQD